MKVYPNRIKHEKFIGTVIGKVTVIEFSHAVEKNKRFWYYYKYKCICGTIETATKHGLSQSKNRDTYCCSVCRKNKTSEWAKWHSVKYIDPIEAKCSVLHSNYRSRAKRKNWEFNLTFQEFKNLVLSNCYYCNLEPNKCRLDRAKSRKGISRIYFNGIDRIDSNKGYIINNVVSCCEDCNKAKRNLSNKQFLELIKRIYEFRNLRENI